MSCEIIDNFLEKEDFDFITSTLFPQNLNNRENFVWNYQKGIVRDPKTGPTDYDEYDWIYVHLLYSSDNQLWFDKYYNIVKPILNKLDIKKLFDIRANLLVPTKEHIYHEIHIDREIPHKVALFYVTSCNGFTIIEENTKVECIKNRLLLFDGFNKHRSVTSTDHPRCVININYA